MVPSSLETRGSLSSYVPQALGSRGSSVNALNSSSPERHRRLCIFPRYCWSRSPPFPAGVPLSPAGMSREGPRGRAEGATSAEAAAGEPAHRRDGDQSGGGGCFSCFGIKKPASRRSPKAVAAPSGGSSNEQAGGGTAEAMLGEVHAAPGATPTSAAQAAPEPANTPAPLLSGSGGDRTFSETPLVHFDRKMMGAVMQDAEALKLPPFPAPVPAPPSDSHLPSPPLDPKRLLTSTDATTVDAPPPPTPPSLQPSEIALEISDGDEPAGYYSAEFPSAEFDTRTAEPHDAAPRPNAESSSRDAAPAPERPPSGAPSLPESTPSKPRDKVPRLPSNHSLGAGRWEGPPPELVWEGAAPLMPEQAGCVLLFLLPPPHPASSCAPTSACFYKTHSSVNCRVVLSQNPQTLRIHGENIHADRSVACFGRCGSRL